MDRELERLKKKVEVLEVATEFQNKMIEGHQEALTAMELLIEGLVEQLLETFPELGSSEVSDEMIEKCDKALGKDWSQALETASFEAKSSVHWRSRQKRRRKGFPVEE